MDVSEYNNIDNYLLGRMSIQERILFEQKILADMNLANAVKDQKQAMDLLEKAHDIEMKLEAQQAQNKYFHEKKSKPILRPLLPWIAVAGVALLLLMFYWNMNGQATGDQLFKEYYVAYDASFGNRNTNDDISIKLSEGSKLYKQGDYANALPILESVLPQVNDGKLLLMIGICQLELKDFDAALNTLELLSNDPVFQHHGSWYAAMAYLNSGNEEKCKLQLEKLVNAKDPNGIFKQAEAIELLKKL